MFCLFQGDVFWRELLIRHWTCWRWRGESGLCGVDQLVGLVVNTSYLLSWHQTKAATRINPSNSWKYGWNLYGLAFSLRLHDLPSAQTLLLYPRVAVWKVLSWYTIHHHWNVSPVSYLRETSSHRDGGREEKFEIIDTETERAFLDLFHGKFDFRIDPVLKRNGRITEWPTGGKCFEWKSFFFFPLRPTVIEAQLNYIDWRNGSMASQLIFKLPHSPSLSPALYLTWVIFIKYLSPAQVYHSVP